LDFHGLGLTCGAWLALAGCHPKVVQALFHHPDDGCLWPSVRADQVTDAIKKLPDMMDA
jgi:hypothetical protein